MADSFLESMGKRSRVLRATTGRRRNPWGDLPESANIEDRRDVPPSKELLMEMAPDVSLVRASDAPPIDLTWVKDRNEARRTKSFQDFVSSVGWKFRDAAVDTVAAADRAQIAIRTKIAAKLRETP